jgi:predicted dehydrogenase
MSKVGIGLIGCGGRLRGVYNRVVNATDQTELIAMCDPNSHSIETTKKFNENAKVYDNYQDLVKDPDIDWVLIGSWNSLHAEHTIAAFNAGKHVFCEKPLALTVEDCLAMRKAWEESKKIFTIGFTLRYSPHYIRIKEIISSGKLGDIISMEFNETLGFNHGGYIHADWRRKTQWAGSHLLEKCCHDIDLVNWMLETTAVKAASFGGCDFFKPENEHHVQRLGEDKNGNKAFQTWNHSKISNNIINPFNDDKDILDNQVAIIEFANGVRSTFHTNCNCAIPERRMYICGTEGTLRADVITGTIEVERIGFESEREDLSTDAKGGHGGGDNILGESLAKSMLEGAPSKTKLEDGLRAAFTAFGIDEAQRTGQVFDFRHYWENAGIEIV